MTEQFTNELEQNGYVIFEKDGKSCLHIQTKAMDGATGEEIFANHEIEKMIIH